MKKVFLKISEKLQKSASARFSFLIKLQPPGQFIKKEALAQVFFYEFCEMFKDAFFIKTLPVVAF